MTATIPPTAETRCQLTELLVAHCAHCRGDVAADAELLAHREQLLQQRGWTAASYAGTCSGCGDWYAPGTAIRHHRDDVLAECCSEDA